MNWSVFWFVSSAALTGLVVLALSIMLTQVL
jgi:hypothetical protein